MLVILLPYFHLRYQLLKSIIFVCVDSRDLCLSSYVQKYVEEPSRISPELNSGSATPVVSLPSLEGTAGDANTASFSRAKGVNVEKACEEVSSNPEPVPLVTVAFPIVGTATKLTNHALKYSSVVTKKEVADDHDGCRFKLMNEPSDPRDSGEGCVSDEEKITLSADMLEELLEHSGLSADQIYTVELIGGASRVPKLQAKLQEFLGRKGLDGQLDADEAIVLGAALHAANDGIRNRTTN
ncbi:hypothetical protein RYX36_026440 [Vicia faba]